MFLTTVYAAIAMVLVPLFYVASHWMNHDHLHRRRTRWLYAMIAGLLWPVLIVGAAQFMAVVAMRQTARRHSGVTMDSPFVTGPIGGIRPWTGAH
ncbi:hypothetical protein [Mycolicibacterium sp.]|jgi:hypothetical protein|uniref:hypothetical protein n=1 Tax=Mycolicibacterium sp. TaxID=2320850 RepID=UPI0028A9D9BC|nr:hypothetical protein [Mycolicibacterium sp.]